MDPLTQALPPAVNAPALTSNYHDFGGLGKLKGQARIDAKSATQEAAQQFEALFLQMMMKSMRDASIKNEDHESSGKDTFEAMFDKEVSLAMAKRNTLGLADLLVKHLPNNAAPNTTELLQARHNAGMALQAAPAQAHSLLPSLKPMLPLPRIGAPFLLKGTP